MIKEQLIKDISFLKVKEKVLIFSALVVLAAYLPTVIHSQPVTGSLVNMSLILAVFLLGPLEAVLLALIPSFFALTSGLLPLPLLPMVPFIIIGNMILICVYHYLGRKNFFLAIAAASFCKFLFIYASLNLFVSFSPGGKQMVPLASMMSWTQFLTAVSGGILAYSVLLFVKKINNHPKR